MQHLVDYLLGVPPLLALGLIGALVFGEAALFVGFVLPGETAVLYGGVLASAGKLSLPVLLVVVILAAILGDSVGFEVGRRVGPRIVDLRVVARHKERLERAQDFLRARGGRAVLIGRATAFLRAVMPALAGASRMPYRRFLPFNALGGVVWGGGCVLLGFFAGHSLHRISQWLGEAGAALFAIVLVAVVVAWHRGRRREV